MYAVAEPEVIKLRAELTSVTELRERADRIEARIRSDLEALLYRKVRILLSEELSGASSDSVQQHIQFRRFGETGWGASFNQLRPVPSQALMVGFEVGDSRAYITLAQQSQQCEWLFDLRYFDVQLVEG